MPSCHGSSGASVRTLVNHILCGVAYRHPVMRMQRGPRGQFSSLYGTTTLRLTPEFPYPPGGPRYERLVFDANDQLIVPLNEWYHLMQGTGAARTRDTYLAVLRPWFGFLANHGYQWNARPEAVREYTGCSCWRLAVHSERAASRAGSSRPPTGLPSAPTASTY